ncbi:hypothetical protein L873DRAFT_1790709 [Choiromyces venosus 120613-1]|uniref:Uncharacterized protein n=1 Tax=Choiromyces venosus 120613-1 TaxID=1336337 RepID=A0A3N4JHT1_9PEZI|nr:hypothetical protein L873DRAFT_1790709 [Choiromyces venosus 120613-1]
MSQIPKAHSAWTIEETEALIEWLEEPENLRKMKKGSGVTKKQVVKEIAAKISTKPEVKVGYMYDNLIKSYREAAKLNNQSGWGLSMEDLDEGKKTLREKLLSRCPFFFHLEAIFGNRPNIHPPARHDSGGSPTEAALAVEKLLNVMSSSIQDKEEILERNTSSGEEGEPESQGRSIQEKSKEMGETERDQQRGQEEEGGILGSQESMESMEERGSEVQRGDEELAVINDISGDISRSKKEKRDQARGCSRRIKQERLSLPRTIGISQSQHTSQLSTSSSIKHGEKWRFLKSLEDEEEEDDRR